jgi:antitoxin CptB
LITTEQELNRLRWRCRRGMRELDALLMKFADEQYAAASGPEQAAFRSLLNLPDPEILGLLTGRNRSDDPGIDGVVRRVLGERFSAGD